MLARLILSNRIINQAKISTNKKKVIVLQPFGRGVYYDGTFLYDKSPRSFTKKTGHKSKKLKSGTSKESKDVNLVSPVAKFTPTKKPR